jgi:hypothetical protein
MLRVQKTHGVLASCRAWPEGSLVFGSEEEERLLTSVGDRHKAVLSSFGLCVHCDLMQREAAPSVSPAAPLHIAVPQGHHPVGANELIRGFTAWVILGRILVVWL